jgi:hypothetical protein
MTTTWKIPADWQGQTVAVLASGPNMSQEVADALRVHRRIVVNHTHRLAPDADMLVAMDGNWHQEWREFAGMRVTGVQDDDLDALYIGPRWERVQLAPGHEIEIHNSGLTAVRIAALMGASRIIMAGFDPENPRHWYDDRVDTGGYVGLSQALRTLEAELTAKGVIVERYNATAAPVTAKAKRV